jgi:hypothetical protein
VRALAGNQPTGEDLRFPPPLERRLTWDAGGHGRGVVVDLVGVVLAGEAGLYSWSV